MTTTDRSNELAALRPASQYEDGVCPRCRGHGGTERDAAGWLWHPMCAEFELASTAGTLRY